MENRNIVYYTKYVDNILIIYSSSLIGSTVQLWTIASSLFLGSLIYFDIW
jgi:hypothetical protein